MRRVMIFVLTLTMTACAGLLSTQYDPPEVQVVSLQMLEPQGLQQRFRVGLVFLNPNASALPVKGLSYSLALNGYDLLQGVSGDIPTLSPYSETLVELELSTDLV